MTSSKRATPNFIPKSIFESSTWFLFYLRKQCSPLALKIAHCKSNLLEINNFLEVSNVRPTLPLHWRPQQHQRRSILRPANEKKVAKSWKWRHKFLLQMRGLQAAKHTNNWIHGNIALYTEQCRKRGKRDIRFWINNRTK